MQSFGLSRKSSEKTMQEFGVGMKTMPYIGSGLVVHERVAEGGLQFQPSPVSFKSIVDVVGDTGQDIGEGYSAPPVVVPPSIIPGMVPFTLIPTRKKKPVSRRRKTRKPKYKYREIRHPFPSLSKLMGFSMPIKGKARRMI